MNQRKSCIYKGMSVGSFLGHLLGWGIVTVASKPASFAAFGAAVGCLSGLFVGDRMDKRKLKRLLSVAGCSASALCSELVRCQALVLPHRVAGSRAQVCAVMKASKVFHSAGVAWSSGTLGAVACLESRMAMVVSRWAISTQLESGPVPLRAGFFQMGVRGVLGVSIGSP